MAGINNKYDYRDGVLTALGVEHTPSDLRNEDDYRKKVLDGFGVEYTDDDINRKNLFREKVVSGLASGGGGGGDFSIANVTVEDPDEYGILVRGAYVMPANPIIEYDHTDVIKVSNFFGTTQVVMNKGVALLTFGLEGQSLAIEGDAEPLTDISIGLVKVTGDCTITIS